jgi:hypothetical protein
MIDRWLVACGAEGAIALAADNDDEYDGGLSCARFLYIMELVAQYDAMLLGGIWRMQMLKHFCRLLFDHLLVACVDVCQPWGHRHLRDAH